MAESSIDAHNVWLHVDPDSENGAKLKRRVDRLESYATAVAHGRHPRSFPKQNLVWDAANQAEDRMKRLRGGQDLRSVMEATDHQGDEGQPSASASATGGSNDSSGGGGTGTGDGGPGVGPAAAAAAAAAGDETVARPAPLTAHEKRVERRKQAKLKVRGMIQAVSSIKYLEHRDVHCGLSEEDKQERHKSMLAVRMFGVHPKESQSHLEGDGGEANNSSGVGGAGNSSSSSSRRGLGGSFRRSDFDTAPGTIALTAGDSGGGGAAAAAAAAAALQLARAGRVRRWC
jgi:hypothetical protein